ncbi:MAG TPA: acyltransferase [Polyangiaceae bacterium]|nr:acyltransferase [Polyangiaceae bacterium]
MTRGASVFLPEIQALRALAVALVVVFHLWPSLLPGGYVGVDALFVLSGFLITSHLLRELLERGTIGLSGFWARRIRRLLPASLFVLGCVTAALPFVPATHFERFTGEALGATFYVLNWLLARSAVDYWADDAASPVQH